MEWQLITGRVSLHCTAHLEVSFTILTSIRSIFAGLSRLFAPPHRLSLPVTQGVRLSSNLLPLSRSTRTFRFIPVNDT
ncbi:hypothetical protein Cob_v001942 [Colletotrichum orbiculare MAFF 240422]|uniref:Uncharacterized protein n=1 Tax=Colletotrichum orbiculare (strain 104-T / ATCC 96160 / CBS 514.97 / LARS 414 / MAFF 240422) TaxID=1213857 RepID=A0A484G7B1_COLOR|nr:hypothetical protein Cob_v001942 [Colletotrichum orbiculare MAFF 240422]